nr:hypothetical protein [Tanacetum cinerariifolium]
EGSSQNFKSLANEADASLAKHKALELEIKRLLKAVWGNILITMVYFVKGLGHNLSSAGQFYDSDLEAAKPDISFLHVFDALCYPKNDREDIGKLGAKGDIGFFIRYFADSCAYRIYNQRTKKIMETMNVSFDELSAMAFEQRSSKPGLQNMTSGQISSGLYLTYAPSTITTQQPSEGELDLLFEAMYDDYIGGQPSTTGRIIPHCSRTSSSSVVNDIYNNSRHRTNSNKLILSCNKYPNYFTGC